MFVRAMLPCRAVAKPPVFFFYSNYILHLEHSFDVPNALMINPDISNAAKNARNADITAIAKICTSSVASAIIEVITVPSAPTASKTFVHLPPD